MNFKGEQMSTLRRLKLEAIKKIVQDIPVKPDHTGSDLWEMAWDKSESELANKVRNVLSSIPKGFNRDEPSLKNQAKERFLQWKRNQAQAEWKKLPEAEQKRWEAYVAEGVGFGEIREREIARESEFGVGDEVVLHHNIGYQGILYRSGSRGTIVGTGWDEIHEEVTFLVTFVDQHLNPMYAHTYELRKVL